MPRKRKVAGAKVRRKKISGRTLEKEPRPTNRLTTYALPFLRKGRGLDWRRFTYDQLKNFLAEYKPDDAEGAEEWREYAVRESWTFDSVRKRDTFKRDVERPFFGKVIGEADKSPVAKARKGRAIERRKGKRKASRK
jgi:hypothetical protein